MASNIIYSKYDPENCITTVSLSDNWGTETATVYLHEEDYNIANKHDGILFAKYKAQVKLLKNKEHALRQRYIGIRSAINAIPAPAPDEDDYTYEKLLVQERDARSRWLDARECREEIECAYRDYVNAVLDSNPKRHRKGRRS